MAPLESEPRPTRAERRRDLLAPHPPANLDFQLAHALLQAVHQLLDVVVGYGARDEGSHPRHQVRDPGPPEQAAAHLGRHDLGLAAAAHHPRGVRGADSETRLTPRAHPHARLDPTYPVDEVDPPGDGFGSFGRQRAPLVFRKFDAGIHLLRRDLLPAPSRPGSRTPETQPSIARDSKALHVSTRFTEEEFPTFFTRYWDGDAVGEFGNVGHDPHHAFRPQLLDGGSHDIERPRNPRCRNPHRGRAPPASRSRAPAKLATCSASDSARASEARKVSPPDNVFAGRDSSALRWSITKNSFLSDRSQGVVTAGEPIQAIGSTLNQASQNLVLEPATKVGGIKVIAEIFGDERLSAGFLFPLASRAVSCRNPRATARAWCGQTPALPQPSVRGLRPPRQPVGHFGSVLSRGNRAGPSPQMPQCAPHRRRPRSPRWPHMRVRPTPTSSPHEPAKSPSTIWGGCIAATESRVALYRFQASLTRDCQPSNSCSASCFARRAASSSARALSQYVLGFRDRIQKPRGLPRGTPPTPPHAGYQRTRFVAPAPHGRRSAPSRALYAPWVAAPTRSPQTRISSSSPAMSSSRVWISLCVGFPSGQRAEGRQTSLAHRAAHRRQSSGGHSQPSSCSTSSKDDSKASMRPSTSSISTRKASISPSVGLPARASSKERTNPSCCRRRLGSAVSVEFALRPIPPPLLGFSFELRNAALRLVDLCKKPTDPVFRRFVGQCRAECGSRTLLLFQPCDALIPMRGPALQLRLGVVTNPARVVPGFECRFQIRRSIVQGQRAYGLVANRALLSFLKLRAKSAALFAIRSISQCSIAASNRCSALVAPSSAVVRFSSARAKS